MSLGIRKSWRSFETHGCSLICRHVLTQQLSHRSYGRTARPTADHDRGLTRPSVLTPALARHYARDATTAPTSTSVLNNDESSESGRRVSRPTTPKPSFIERLAQVPVATGGSQGSILVRPKMEYPNKRETEIHAYKVHRELKAQEFLHEQRLITKAKLPDWRKLLETMMLATPLYLDGVVELHIPQDQAYLLLDPEREGSIWDLKARMGAHMELEKRPRKDGTIVCRISGTRRAIDEAITAAVDLAKKIKLVLLSNGAETVLHDETAGGHQLGDGTAQGQNLGDNSARAALTPQASTELLRPRLVRSLRYNLSSKEAIILQSRPEDVPRPEAWTKESFEEYVYTLTHGVLPTSVASKIYPAGTSHEAEVTKQLHRVFSYPETQSAQTLAAFKVALRYMARRGPGARPDTRALFVRAEMNGIHMDTGVFNILAEDNARQRDLGNFSACVNLLVRRGLEPNIRTWMLFLRLVQDEQVKRYIFQAMHSRNLLSDLRHVAMIATNMATYDAERAVRDGWQLDFFLQSQAALYGPRWFVGRQGRHTVNRILEVLLKHSKFDEAVAFLNRLHHRDGFSPNIVTLNICLHHAKIHNNMRFARGMLAKFQRQDISPTADSITHLFNMCWRKRWPHSVDALWQYSLLTLQTNYHMRTRIGGILHEGFENGWDRQLPDGSAQLPRAELTKAGVFSLLLTSARTLLGDPTAGATDRDSRALMDHVLGRAHNMRADGWAPAASTSLALLLTDAAERDARFHEGTKKGELILEPTEMPTEQSLPRLDWPRADDARIAGDDEALGEEEQDVEWEGGDAEEL